MAGLFLIGLIACLAVGISTSRAQQTYTLTDLGNVEGMTAIEPAAINNTGQIAGTASAGGEACAFRYYNKKMEDIGSTSSRAFAINSVGVVAGESWVDYPVTFLSHAAIFKGGTAIDLGMLKGGLFSRANGINSREYVVGFSGSDPDSNANRAFVWHASTGMVDIGTLGGAYAEATAINDANYVTGRSEVARMGLMTVSHAFLYQVPASGSVPLPMRDLGTLGGASSHGMAINMNNHVVGYSTLNTADRRFHAFFYDGGKLIDIGSLGKGAGPADYSVALGINNFDQVVGYTYLPSKSGKSLVPRQVAFIYRHTPQIAMKDLNTLIGRAASHYWVFSATAINDRGEIVACAYYDRTGDAVHAVLLTPITTPYPPPAP